MKLINTCIIATCLCTVTVQAQLPTQGVQQVQQSPNVTTLLQWFTWAQTYPSLVTVNEINTLRQLIANTSMLKIDTQTQDTVARAFVDLFNKKDQLSNDGKQIFLLVANNPSRIKFLSAAQIKYVTTKMAPYVQMTSVQQPVVSASTVQQPTAQVIQQPATQVVQQPAVQAAQQSFAVTASAPTSTARKTLTGVRQQPAKQAARAATPTVQKTVTQVTQQPVAAKPPAQAPTVQKQPVQAVQQPVTKAPLPAPVVQQTPVQAVGQSVTPPVAPVAPLVLQQSVQTPQKQLYSYAQSIQAIVKLKKASKILATLTQLLDQSMGKSVDATTIAEFTRALNSLAKKSHEFGPQLRRSFANLLAKAYQSNLLYPDQKPHINILYQSIVAQIPQAVQTTQTTQAAQAAQTTQTAPQK